MSEPWESDSLMVDMSNPGHISQWSALVDATTSLDVLKDGYLRAPEPVKTGITALDEALGGGWFPGENILAGEPGAGKTALAVQSLAMNAKRGNESLYWSLEMPAMQIVMRIMSFYSHNTNKLKDFAWAHPRECISDTIKTKTERDISPFAAMPDNDVFYAWLDQNRAEFEAMDDAELFQWTSKTEENGYVPLLLQYGDAIAMAHDYWEANIGYRMPVIDSEVIVENACIMMDRVCQEGVRPLVAYDYMQHAEVSSLQDATEYDRVTRVSHDLTECAKRNKIPIIAICSLNKLNGATPTMDSLRGSGNIKYDAESIIIISHDEREEKSPKYGIPVNATVLKNRSGMAGDVIPLWFDGKYNSFRGREVPHGTNGAG